MRKRALTIEWRARPAADGDERLVLAMKLLIERAQEDAMAQRIRTEEETRRDDEARS